MITILTAEEYKKYRSHQSMDYMKAVMVSSVVLESAEDNKFYVRKDRFTGKTGDLCDMEELEWLIKKDREEH